MQTLEKPLSEGIEKIAKEAPEAACTNWDVLKMVKQLQEEEHTSFDRLRKRAVELLEKINPKAAVVYASFNRMHVLTSKETIEAFDMGNIIKSLIKETNITRGIAEKIGNEVEDKIKDLNIKNLNTALIRNLVNVKLLEYGHENIYHQYQRIGMPAFEIKEKLKHTLFQNKEILQEYHWQNVIPEKARDYHFENDLYIECVEDFSTKPLCSVMRQDKNIESIHEGMAEIAKKLNYGGIHSSYPANLQSANFAFWKSLEKLPNKAISGFAKELL